MAARMSRQRFKVSHVIRHMIMSSSSLVSGTPTDRLACSLSDARNIVEELTTAEVRLNIGGSLHDPNNLIGRLLFSVLAMTAESDLIRIRTTEGMKVAKAKPAAGQTTQTQPHPTNSSGWAVPRRPAHHHRTSRTVLRQPIDDLSRCPTRRRTWCRPNTVVGLHGLGLVTAQLPAPSLASSIEQHAVRSSLMSRLERACDFNALMPMLRIPTTVNFGGCQDYGKHRS